MQNNPEGPTAEEIQWAVAIKRAAQADEGINADKISDLEYLQYGIVFKSDVSKAMDRIKHMQDFKREFGIQLDGSLEHAERDINMFYAVHPGMYLALAALPDGTHVMCSDYGQFQKVGSQEALSIRMRGFFYHLQACQCNISAMRAGFCSLLDFSGTVITRIPFKIQKRIFAVFSKAYPIRGRQVVMTNTSPVINFIWNILLRRFFSKKLRERFVICDDHTEFFATSFYTPEVLPRAWGGLFDSSEKSMKHAVRQKLEERYALMAKFRLVLEEESTETATSVGYD